VNWSVIDAPAAPARTAADRPQSPVQREPMLQALMESSTDAMVVMREDGCAQYVNRAARQLFGSDGVVGLPLPLVGPWAPGSVSERSRIDSQGRERRLELRVAATEWNGQPALLLAVRDLTERHAAEQGLLLSRRAMESSANGIIICDAQDPRQPVIYVNPAFERITGYTVGEVIGRNCRFLQGSERDQPALGRLREALARGSDVQVELRNFRKDGTPFWNELNVSPVRNPAGVVTHFVGIQNDITARREQEAELLRRLTHDPLTALPNRNLLLDRLRRALAIAGEKGRNAALLYVDLDQFREINDALGHDAGDEVLRTVASRLREGVRPGDTLARLGGDEFLVLLPDLASPDEAGTIAAQLLDAVARPYELAGTTVFCSCSIGVAHVKTFGDDPLQLIRRADLAVNAAKRAGRNTVQFEAGDQAQRVSERLELRTLLHGAIGRNELALHYQPQMDLVNQRICGIEALLRWQHPVLGAVSPARFIPVAEETGQIVPLGEWVLNEACRQHRQWLDSGLLDCPVAVNVSSVQFQRANFVDLVEAALARHRLPASRLELELTESVTMDSGGGTLAKLARLRELGVRMAIDDFGTGFSSLAYLKRLPIDKVKIDRAFIDDLTHDSDDASITLSVIAIAHHLRLRVVAEGVETMAQLAYLKRHLCDEVQGFLVARPLPAAELETFLAGFQPPGSEAANGEVDQGGGPTLLLVDDEPNILRALTRTLRRDGYRILTAGGAAEAFDVLARHDVHVIVSDQRMPQMCGTDFLSQVKSMYPDTVRLVLSGYTDLVSVTEAINRGAIYRFLTKPWSDEQLRGHVREAFVHQQGRRSAARVA
jgi:diguanylate cyclase (GGDEF)-like protein/PAS domain S-box-containing protein